MPTHVNPWAALKRLHDLKDVCERIDRVSSSEATVLVTGENGTGKELVARAIHSRSPRARSTFIAVNCGAFSEGLLEAELFGHARGAFTGATTDRAGVFEQANRGVLFLDEVGTMSPALQVKLLRVLQERELRRVGGTSTIPIDVRLIAATNADLATMVRDGEFRQDLYFRLNVVSIHIPPLRERRFDLALLIDAFLEESGARNRVRKRQLSEAALAFLRQWPWPGNVRELENVIERTTILAGAEYVDEIEIAKFLQESELRGEALNTPVVTARAEDTIAALLVQDVLAKQRPFAGIFRRRSAAEETQGSLARAVLNAIRPAVTDLVRIQRDRGVKVSRSASSTLFLRLFGFPPKLPKDESPLKSAIRAAIVEAVKNESSDEGLS